MVGPMSYTSRSVVEMPSEHDVWPEKVVTMGKGSKRNRDLVCKEVDRRIASNNPIECAVREQEVE